MGQVVTGCRVEVPTVQHVRALSPDESGRPPSIRLSFQTAEATRADEDLYYLSLIEAEDVAAWLIAAAQSLDVGVSDGADLAVTRETYGSADGLIRRRLALYGSKLAPADDCDEVGIVVDVAGALDGLSRTVRLAFIDDVIAYSLPAVRAREIASALVAALAHLANNPPVVVRDLIVGSFPVATSDGSFRPVEVDAQAEAVQPIWPRVAIHIAADERGPAICGDSWYLLDDEAARISEFLDAAAAAADRQQPGSIGELKNDGPASDSPTWLAVAVEVPPFEAKGGVPWVFIRFDDPLVRESGSDGCIWLRPEAALAASRLLMAALGHVRSHPPVDRRSTQEHVIADLRWDRPGGTD